MNVRFATSEDSESIFEWRSEEVTRSMSTNTGVVDWKEHIEWYKLALLNPSKVILVGEDDKGKIGVVRIDYDYKRKLGDISINLNPVRRTQGLSSSLLRKAICFVKLPMGLTLRATIKHNNVASIRCFNNCGFRFSSRDDEYIYLVK